MAEADNALLPLPYSAATLATVCDHIDEVQDVIGRRMLLENPLTYLAFRESTMSETEFIRSVASRTGCGLGLGHGLFRRAALVALVAYSRKLPLAAVAARGQRLGLSPKRTGLQGVRR
jgi:uncharacterized protein